MTDAPMSTETAAAWTLGDRLAAVSVLLPAVPSGPVLLAVPSPLAEALQQRFPDARLVSLAAGRPVTVPGGPVEDASATLLVVDERVADPEALRGLVAPGGTLAVIGGQGPFVIHPDTEHPEQIWARGWPVPVGGGPLVWARRRAALHLAGRRGTPRLSVEGAVPSLADDVIADVARATGTPARLVGVVAAGHAFLRLRTAGGDLAVKLTLVSRGRLHDPSRPVAAEVADLGPLLPDEVAAGTTHGHPWVASRWTPSGRLAGRGWWRRTTRQRAAAHRVVDVLAGVCTGSTEPGWATTWVDAAAIVPAPVRHRLARSLEPLEHGLPTSWCHGDLWPGNLLVDRADVVVIDWDNAVRDAPQGLDRLLIPVTGPGAPPGSATVSERILALADADAELVQGKVAGRGWQEWSPEQRRTLALAACVLYLRNRSLHDLGGDQLERELAVLAPEAADHTGAQDEPGSPDDARRTARGALWLGTSSLVVKTSQTLVLLTLAALLAPSALGLVALGTLVANISAILANLGTANALVYWRGDVQRAARTSVTIALVGGGVLAALLWLIAPWLAATFRAEDGGAAVIRGLTVVLPCVAVAAVTGELLRRELRFARRVVPDIVASVVGAVVAVVLAATGYGVMSLVVGQIIQGVLTMLLAWVVHPPVLPGWSSEDARALLSYGGPLSAASLLEIVQLNLDYLFVSRVLGALALGYYSLAFRLAYLPYLMIVIVITGAAFPSLCRRRGTELGRAAERVAATTLTLVVPLALGLVLLRDHLLLLGDKWEPAVPVVAWLAAYGVLLSVGQVVQVTLNASGRPALSLCLRMSHLVGLLVALPVAVGHGIVAVAVAQVVVVSLVATFALVLAARTVAGLSLLRLAGRLRAPLGGAIAMTVTVLVLQALRPADPGSLVDFVLAGVAAVAAYAGAVWVLDRQGLREVGTLVRRPA